MMITLGKTPCASWRLIMAGQAFFALAFFITLSSSPAQAQNEIVITPPECRLLPDHSPQADVAYRGGVDVKGRAVAPADLNAAPMGDVFQTVIVPLTVDLAERLTGAGQVPGLQLEGNLGYLEIHADGRVLHNGRDWTSQIYLLCGKSVASPDGQATEDVIKYEPAD